jgi:hypothetical protein
MRLDANNIQRFKLVTQRTLSCYREIGRLSFVITLHLGEVFWKRAQRVMKVA